MFSYPYVNLVPNVFSRMREYELGLDFVDRCRELLTLFADEIPKNEAVFIERDVTFLELAFLDGLNRWRDYLELFERYFLEKRTDSYIQTYSTGKGHQEDYNRFGRYLIGYNANGFALVHSFYGIEHRRRIIEKKQIRLEEGKSVEHLKRHQKDRLSTEELDRRYKELNRLLRWMKKASDGG